MSAHRLGTIPDGWPWQGGSLSASGACVGRSAGDSERGRSGVTYSTFFLWEGGGVVASDKSVWCDRAPRALLSPVLTSTSGPVGALIVATGAEPGDTNHPFRWMDRAAPRFRRLGLGSGNLRAEGQHAASSGLGAAHGSARGGLERCQQPRRWRRKRTIVDSVLTYIWSIFIFRDQGLARPRHS